MKAAYSALQDYEMEGRTLEVEYEFPEVLNDDWDGDINNDFPDYYRDKDGGRGGRRSPPREMGRRTPPSRRSPNRRRGRSRSPGFPGGRRSMSPRRRSLARRRPRSRSPYSRDDRSPYRPGFTD